jgi:hypothetical protein
MKNFCSGTHHRESRHLVPATPPVGAGSSSRTVLGGKGALRRANNGRALASCAPFCPTMNRDGRLRREPDAVQFLRLAKDENQMRVDKTS